jgi:hypothetical protein
MIPKTFSLLLLVLALAATAGASLSAGGGYSVKQKGLWYWSADLTDSIYPPVETPLIHPDPYSLLRGLPLSVDQKRELAARLAAHGPFRGKWKPSWTDGTVVFAMACTGSGTSIASVDVNIDLFHTFRCKITGATFKRLATFEAAAQSARSALAAATAPTSRSSSTPTRRPKRNSAPIRHAATPSIGWDRPDRGGDVRAGISAGPGRPPCQRSLIERLRSKQREVMNKVKLFAMAALAALAISVGGLLLSPTASAQRFSCANAYGLQEAYFTIARMLNNGGHYTAAAYYFGMGTAVTLASC